jgi:LacI family transcriptional regulator
MADVARLAGVSQGTVSHALNHPDRLTPEMLRRVRGAIDELGFARNGAARSLAAGTSRAVGFVLVDLGNSLFVDIARGAEAAAAEEGMFLTIANSDIQAGKQETYLDLFHQERVAGVLLAPVEDSLRGVDRVREQGLDVVVVDAPAPEGFCSVQTNNRSVGYVAARHLLEQGRRRLVFVGGPRGLRPIADRITGAGLAVAEVDGATLEVLPTRQLRAEHGRAAGAVLAERAGPAMPDGIVAAADLLAMGIQQTLLSTTSLRIPDDVALVACDDNRSAYDTVVPISTVTLPGYAMGRSAMELLLEELRDPDRHEHHAVVIEPGLVARESTTGRRTA